MLTFTYLLIGAAIVFYLVRVVRRRREGVSTSEALRDVGRAEHVDRYGFSIQEQHAEASRLQAADPTLSNYKALRQARKNLTPSA